MLKKLKDWLAGRPSTETLRVLAEKFDRDMTDWAEEVLLDKWLDADAMAELRRRRVDRARRKDEPAVAFDNSSVLPFNYHGTNPPLADAEEDTIVFPAPRGTPPTISGSVSQKVEEAPPPREVHRAEPEVAPPPREVVADVPTFSPPPPPPPPASDYSGGGSSYDSGSSGSSGGSFD